MDSADLKDRNMMLLEKNVLEWTTEGVKGSNFLTNVFYFGRTPE